MRFRAARLAGLLVLAALVPAAWAWGAPLHRMVSDLALETLPPEAPDWLRDAELRGRVAFHSNQPDRWRGWSSDVLKHENDPEHYLDIELLDQFGLTLETVPRLRLEYLRQMAVAKERQPERVEPYDPAKDPARTHEWPGFVLHAVAEHYARLQAAFNQVRIIEKLAADGDPRRLQSEEARAIAAYHMGALAHFVADMAQPLHTSKHYNGWVGENPQGYRWREKFHAYIDEGWALANGVDSAAIRRRMRPVVVAADPWDDVLRYFRRAHAQLEPLYALERDGKLDGPDGRELLERQLADAASLLSGLVWSAYSTSAPVDRHIESWQRYDEPPAATRPAAP